MFPRLLHPSFFDSQQFEPLLICPRSPTATKHARDALHFPGESPSIHQHAIRYDHRGHGKSTRRKLGNDHHRRGRQTVVLLSLVLSYVSGIAALATTVLIPVSVYIMTAPRPLREQFQDSCKTVKEHVTTVDRYRL